MSLTAPRRTTAAFALPGYRRFWLAGAASSFASTMSVIAIGWTTLQVSDSSLAVAAAFAARLVPALILGIPLGAVVDRFARRPVLVVTSVAGAALLALLAALAAMGQLGFAALLLVSLGLGSVETMRGAASQAYAFDLAGPDGATNAIALSNVGGFVVGVAASLAGGFILDAVGPTNTFLVAAGAALLAAAILVPGRRAAAAVVPRERAVPNFGRALSLLLRNPTVALIAFVVIVAEILGFSCATLFPTFARDVLGSDATGLGALVAARYVGAIVALLALARTSLSGGRWIVAATLLFGLSLIGFALSRSFAFSLLLLALVGVASAGIDTLVQTLLQRRVDDSERGAAAGVWYFGTGFGPIGQLALGAAATGVGAPTALAVSGALLALTGVALGTLARVRRL